MHLDGSARDEEPFVVYAINGCWPQVLVGLDVEGAGVDAIRRMRDGDIGAGSQLVLSAHEQVVGIATYSEIPPG